MEAMTCKICSKEIKEKSPKTGTCWDCYDLVMGNESSIGGLDSMTKKKIIKVLLSII